MTRRPARPAAVAALALVAVTACGEHTGRLVAPDASSACVDAAGTWVLASGSDVFGDRVLVARIGVESAAAVVELPSYSAGGALGTVFVPASAHASTGCSAMLLGGALAATDAPVEMALGVRGDSALGELESAGEVEPVFGWRFDQELLVSPESLPAAGASADSTPMVLLRVDDASAADRTFLPRVSSRHLVAELSIPTQLVGQPDRLTWGEIHAWADSGFGIAAHSRWHSELTDPGLGFVSEVVGSLADLRSRGLGTTVFVQPGSWHDSLDFDSPGKLANWRGAVFRDFTRAFEAYATPWVVPNGRIGDVPLGISHFTVSDAATKDWLLEQWPRMLTSGSYTVLLVHSVNVEPPDKLDWLLDSIHAAVAQGRLRLAHLSTDLLRGATGARIVRRGAS